MARHAGNSSLMALVPNAALLVGTLGPTANAAAQDSQNTTQTTTQTSTQTTAQPTTQTTTAPGRGVRVTSGGVRAPGGGVRTTGGGVRAPSGGVRVTGGGVRTTSGGVRVTSGGVRVTSGGVRAPGGAGVPGDHDHGHDPHDDCICYYPYYGWGWGYGWSHGWGWWVIPDSYRGPVDGPSDRRLVGDDPQPPAEPPTPIESARWLMADGDAAGALGWYRAVLDESPDDARVMREYASALLEAGRPLDAVAVMGYAYDRVPALSGEPMDVGLWGGSVLRLRASVVDAVKFGHRSPSGNAWLLVAVLMQAEGRDAVALRMVDRAEDEGLGASVSDRMRLVLTQR